MVAVGGAQRLGHGQRHHAVARGLDARDRHRRIGRGGLVPAAYLSHRTGIQMLSVDHSSGEAGFGDDPLYETARAVLTGLAGTGRAAPP